MRSAFVCLALLLAAAAPGAAQPPTEPEPVKLTIRPAGVPSLALKYQLLPELKDQTPGNAALVYYRAFSPESWGSFRHPGVLEKVVAAIQAPLKDVPRQNLNWVLNSSMLREVDRAARREYVDWELAERVRREGIMVLLPDIQGLREMGQLLSLRARLEIAQGNHDKAVYTLQTGLALARHTGEGPLLIQALVAIAIAQQTLDRLEELIQQPGAPNFYWALTDLPRPFADLRKPLQGEKLTLYAGFPLLGDIETVPLTPQQQQQLLGALGAGMERALGYGPRPGWTDRLAGVGLVMRAYPGARRALVAEGRPPAEVEALPALQVMLIDALHQYRRLQDDLFRWYGLPYWEARPGLERAERQERRARQHLEGRPFLDFLPRISRVVFVAVRMDRRIAALRCIEAVRLHAAAHDGKLPAALADIHEVPIPLDPVTGKPFEYRASGDRATLYAPPPPGEQPRPDNIVNYQLTLSR
jgi:hypothetical protein